MVPRYIQDCSLQNCSFDNCSLHNCSLNRPSTKSSLNGWMVPRYIQDCSLEISQFNETHFNSKPISLTCWANSNLLKTHWPFLFILINTIWTYICKTIGCWMIICGGLCFWNNLNLPLEPLQKYCFFSARLGIFVSHKKIFIGQTRIKELIFWTWQPLVSPQDYSHVQQFWSILGKKFYSFLQAMIYNAMSKEMTTINLSTSFESSRQEEQIGSLGVNICKSSGNYW